MFSVPHQLRRLARVQCGMLTGKELNLDAKELEQTLQLSFYVKEIGVSATVCPILWQLPTCDHPREHGLLINPVAVFHEAEPGFEQANSRLLTVLIVSHGFQQSAPEARAHDRQVVVTVYPSNFFDQILFDTDIRAETRHVYPPAILQQLIDMKAQTGQNFFHRSAVDLQPQHVGNTCLPKVHRAVFRQVLLADNLDNIPRLATHDGHQQCRCTLHGIAGKLVVHATLEPM